jgi:AhpD family alkylhydroperoxidase
MVQARIKNPVVIFPHVRQRLQSLQAMIDEAELASTIQNLVRLRASQINGSSPCVYAASKQAREEGETDTRLLSVAVWRHTPYFTAAEQAALALTEMVTRLEGTDPVPESVWQEATKHFDERSLAALLLTLSITNINNRLNVSTRQVAGA